MTEVHKHKTGFGLSLKKGDTLYLSNRPLALEQIFFGYSGGLESREQTNDENDKAKETVEKNWGNATILNVRIWI